jgi:DNA-binding NarL/FixJ family response regulator
VPRLSPRSNERISVLIVTSDNMTSELLKNAFKRGRQEFTVATLTGSSQKVIGELGAHKPNVALICEELQDGRQTGFRVLKKIRDVHPRTAPIMLVQNSTPECVVDTFRQGARGIFCRTHFLKDLSKCIKMVHQGQIWACTKDLKHILSALVHMKPLQFNDSDGMPLLTRREEDVVRLVADGLKNREIPEKLNVAEHSIRNYLYRIFDKLGVSTRVELILYAFSRREQGN